MITDLAPGVYFEARDRPPAGIRRVRTDIAGFLGVAERGPLHKAVRIESFLQFTTRFGRHTPNGYLSYAVEGFFANGGRVCHVVRVADPDRAKPACLTFDDFNGHKTLRLEAVDPGRGGREISIRIDSVGRERFTLKVLIDGVLQEIWRDLSMRFDDERYAPKLINPKNEDEEDEEQEEHSKIELGTKSKSDWIRAFDLKSPSMFSDSNPYSIHVEASTTSDVETRGSQREGHLSGGHDGLSTLRPVHFAGDGAPSEKTWGLKVLEKVDEVAIVAIPDTVWIAAEKPKPWFRCGPPNYVEWTPKDPARPDADQRAPFDEAEIIRLQRAIIGHCERLKDRFAVIDVPEELGQAKAPMERVVDWRNQYQSKYAAMYYPWLRVPRPAGDRADLADVPPSGHVAGMFARVDLTVGVHKPPANELLEMVRDLSIRANEKSHAFLNDRHINVVRAFPGRGIRVAGARTLINPQDEPRWRFVNVRRLITMIAESIDESLQWTVFEPNNPRTWLDIERVVRNFLDELWLQGMLDGATADEAYHAICDETTNPPEQIDLGMVVCQIGVRPPRPAEYVIVRIGRTENGTQVFEGNGVGNG